MSRSSGNAFPKLWLTLQGQPPLTPSKDAARQRWDHGIQGD
jgi:hypothetical protein